MRNSLLTLLFFISMITYSQGQQFNSTALDQQLASLLSEKEPGLSVMVSQNGSPLYIYNRGLAQVEIEKVINTGSRFRMASVSKQVTALAIYQLIEKRRLALSDNLGKWFRNLPAAIQDIQVGQLLNHSSGIYDYEDLIPKDRQIQVMDGDIIDLLQNKNSLYFQPGTAFRYSNTGYCLLSLIVEKVSGLPFDIYVQQSLFDPLRLKFAAIYRPNAVIFDRVYGYHPEQGAFHFADQSITSGTQGDGGVYFSSQDFHLWTFNLLTDYFKRPRYEELQEENEKVVKDNVSYSLGFFKFTDKEGHSYLFHSGESTGFNNIISIDLHNKIIISVFTNRDDDLASKAFERIQSALYGEPFYKSFQKPLFPWLAGIYAQGD
ncbi:serine hydrolase domain-containing protein [Sphingobacterium sp. MYb382]